MSLPTEVLQQILLLLPRLELSICARVSKAWRTVITPLLYEHVDLVWRRPISMCDRGMDILLLDPCPCEEMGCCDRIRHLDAPISGVLIPRRHSHHLSSSCIAQPFGSQRSYPSLYLLARTLVSAPALARLVLCLRLIGPVPRSVWTNPEQTCLALCDRNRAQLVIDSCGRISSNEWLEKLDIGEPTAFAALVLACVTRLRQLELGPDLQNVLTFISPECLVKLLPCLSTASVGVSEEKVWMGRGRAPLYESSDAPQLLFLRLPALQSLALNIPSARMSNLPPIMKVIPAASRLQSLSLAYTHLDEKGLYGLLLTCPNLQSLKYDYWTRSPAEDPEDDQPDPMNGPPNTSSQALVDISTLEQALRLIKDTLQTLHLHIVSPRGAWHQLLQRICFCDFPCLTTLHAPLQLLVNKQEKVDGHTMKLQHALPPTLQELWLNDDGAVLWLNHYDFISPCNIDWTLDDMWFGQRNHPIHTDEEVVGLVQDLLSSLDAHVPALRSLKLLFYFFDSPAWGHRDVPSIRDALARFDDYGRVTVSIYELLKRSYRCQGGFDSLATNGQYPPYFDKKSIEAATKTDKYIREH